MVDTGDPKDPWTLTVRLLTGGVRTAAEAQQRLLQAMGLAGEGPDGGPTATDQVERYWRGVATATATYYRELARAISRYDEPSDTTEPGGRHHATTAAPRARIALDGSVGSAVAASFTVENSDPDPARVALVQGPCRTPGRKPFAAPASIEPATATIPPGDTIAVTVRIDLDPELFTPGRSYVMPVRVDGPRPTGVDIEITVDDAAEEPATGPPFRVKCPACTRTFERKTTNLRLRPHKTPDGDDCPERDGRRIL